MLQGTIEEASGTRHDLFIEFTLRQPRDVQEVSKALVKNMSPSFLESGQLNEIMNSIKE